MGQFLGKIEQQIPNMLRDFKVRINRAEHKIEKLEAKASGTDTGGIEVTYSASMPDSAKVGDLWNLTDSGGTGVLSTYQAVTGYASGAGVAADWQQYQVNGAAIVAGTVANTQLATDAVAADNIATGAVTQDAIATGAVTNSALATSAVKTANIASGTSVPGAVDNSTITGAKFVATGTSGDILAYNGTPASGNLITSVSPVDGTDSLSNAFKQGVTVYGASGSYAQMSSNGKQGTSYLYLKGQAETHNSAPPQVYGGGSYPGAANESTGLVMSSGYETTPGANGSAMLYLGSKANDSTYGSAMKFYPDNGGTTPYISCDVNENVFVAPIMAGYGGTSDSHYVWTYATAPSSWKSGSYMRWIIRPWNVFTIQAEIQWTGNVGLNATLATFSGSDLLPAHDYKNAIGVYQNGAATSSPYQVIRINYTTGGVLNLLGSGATINEVDFSIDIPLD